MKKYSIGTSLTDIDITSVCMSVAPKMMVRVGGRCSNTTIQDSLRGAISCFKIVKDYTHCVRSIRRAAALFVFIRNKGQAKAQKALVVNSDTKDDETGSVQIADYTLSLFPIRVEHLWIRF